MRPSMGTAIAFPAVSGILAHMHAPHARRRQSGCCG
ncbi:hypothetical protein AAULH_14311, partial [Lactobacillus helveticus MTCC 5463]